MQQASCRRAGRGGGWIFLFVATALVTQTLAAEVLFPKALHLTRRIEDPVSKAPIIVEEYCVGNRVVTVRGDTVVIADYGLQQLTEIDHSSGTYSITRFEEIAKAATEPVPYAATARATTRQIGVTTAESGRSVDRVEVITDQLRIEVSVDRAVQLRRPALDVLLGAAYPHRPSLQHDLIAQAAGLGLPTEQIITHVFEERAVTVRNVITRVGEEVIPLELLAIPAGAVRVESRFSATNRTAAELDRP